MRENVIAAINYIHKQGLEQSLWNVEEHTVSSEYYGYTRAKGNIYPHIAIYGEAEPPYEITKKSDYIINVGNRIIYFYEF